MNAIQFNQLWSKQSINVTKLILLTLFVGNAKLMK